jgi:hypothetical protein
LDLIAVDEDDVLFARWTRIGRYIKPQALESIEQQGSTYPD